MFFLKGCGKSIQFYVYHDMRVFLGILIRETRAIKVKNWIFCFFVCVVFDAFGVQWEASPALLAPQVSLLDPKQSETRIRWLKYAFSHWCEILQPAWMSFDPHMVLMPIYVHTHIPTYLHTYVLDGCAYIPAYLRGHMHGVPCMCCTCH